MLKALIISFSDLENDPRVNRQIKLIATQFNTTIVGYKDANISDVQFIEAPNHKESLVKIIVNICLLKMRLYSRYYWSLNLIKSVSHALKGKQFDLIVANDLNALPLAFNLANNNTKVIFDAHEYFPREFEEQFEWRFVFQSYVIWQCKNYIPKVDAMLTVCEGIAEEYERCFNVKPIVVPNTPVFNDLSPSEVDDDVIRMVYHGNANPSRQLDLMIDVVNELDERFTLDFVLVGDKKYIKYLQQKAGSSKRIKFIPPVPMSQLPAFTNQYDIGIYLLPPANFNSQMALPNKLFEYIQARLAVVIGPSLEMARIVKKYDCGIVSDEFTPKSLAECLNKITRENIVYYKQQSNEAANQLCFEKVSETMLDIIKRTVEE